MIEILMGLPGSGKSTYAKKRIQKDHTVVRVNKDIIRKMLHNGQYSPDNEEIVLLVRDSIILGAINDGRSVIVDDTNTKQKHIDQITSVAKKSRYSTPPRVEVKIFETDLDECILRDSLRSCGVGEKVIRDMHEDWVLGGLDKKFEGLKK